MKNIIENKIASSSKTCSILQIEQIIESLAMINQGFHAKSIKDISEVLSQTRDTLGCHSIQVIALDYSHQNQQVIITSCDQLLNNSHANLYLDKKMFQNNNIIDKIIKNNVPVLWSDILNNSIDSEEYLPYINILKNNNIDDAITFPYREINTNNRYILLTLTFSKKWYALFGNKIHNCLRNYIEILFECIGEAIFRVCFQNNIFIKKINLTDKETQILNWATKGKSSWEIAKIMNISERNVKYYFSIIYKKLDVVNRQQAIAIAVHYKII